MGHAVNYKSRDVLASMEILQLASKDLLSDNLTPYFQQRAEMCYSEETNQARKSMN